MATADLCRQTNHEIAIQQYPERFRRSMNIGDVLFCCVDSIATRKLIWEAASTRTRLFVDGRMSAEAVRVLAAGDDASRRHYPTTLFAQAEAFRGRLHRQEHHLCRQHRGGANGGAVWPVAPRDAGGH